VRVVRPRLSLARRLRRRVSDQEFGSEPHSPKIHDERSRQHGEEVCSSKSAWDSQRVPPGRGAVRRRSEVIGSSSALAGARPKYALVDGLAARA
jgi:hypothetical protein